MPLSQKYTQVTKPVPAESWRIFILIGACCSVAYSNSFQVPAIFDDYASLIENIPIRTLSSLIPIISAPNTVGLAWRPLTNISFAITYAVSGLNPWAHHLFNLCIHILTAGVLFGVIRLTLSKIKNLAISSEASLLGASISLIWAVHPLQTQTVTYISQRCESLAALFYLLTLYSFIRAVPSNQNKWLILSVLSFSCGILCKEIIITVPCIILLYDVIFISGNLNLALKSRWKYYTLLCVNWLPLAYLLKAIKHQAVGYDIGVTSWTYLLTESKAVLTYLGLCFWPRTLIFDRGPLFLHSFSEALPYGLAVVFLLGLTLWAIKAYPRLGFIGAFFFIVLSPTSSIVPIAEAPIAENRVYLPLAAAVSLGVIALRYLTNKRVTLGLCAVIICLGTALTYARNTTYSSAFQVWKDTTLKAPTNWRAFNNLGYLLLDIPDRQMEAKKYFEASLSIKPNNSEAHGNLGIILSKQPHHEAEAITEYRAAIACRASNAEAHLNLANALYSFTHTSDEAEEHFKTALSYKPYSAVFHNDYALYLATIPKRTNDALAEYKEAIRLNPDYAEAHNNLGNLLSHIPNNEQEAIDQYTQAISLNPSVGFIRYNLALILRRYPQHLRESLEQFRAYLKLTPLDSSEQQAVTHFHIADILGLFSDNRDEAISEYKTALELNPKLLEAHIQLAQLYERNAAQLSDARSEYTKALVIDPKAKLAQDGLNRLLSH